MFDHEHGKREWLSWLLVMVWTGSIFLTIPMARYLTDYVRSEWGGKTFTYSISVMLIGSAGVALAFLLKRGEVSLAKLSWLVGITGVYVYLTFSLRHSAPEEAMHYLVYGVLSILIYRAFSHRISDYSIYVATALVGTLVGVFDEFVQWLVPKRYFDTRDIWLNFSAIVLVQIAIATVIRPQNISGWPRARSLQRLCYLGAALVAVLGLYHLNTPNNIATYTARIPALSFIRESDEVMIEYGHLYDEPDTGLFRSRFTIEELRQSNYFRAHEAAKICADFQDKKKYLKFLRTYTDVKALFIHEAKLHLHSRNVNLAGARAAKTPNEQRLKYIVAHRENRILEKYFKQILQACNVFWSNKTKSEVQEKNEPGKRYESRVSKHLITGYTQSQSWRFSLSAIIGLLILGQWAKRREARGSS